MPFKWSLLLTYRSKCGSVGYSIVIGLLRVCDIRDGVKYSRITYIGKTLSLTYQKFTVDLSLDGILRINTFTARGYCNCYGVVNTTEQIDSVTEGDCYGRDMYVGGEGDHKQKSVIVIILYGKLCHLCLHLTLFPCNLLVFSVSALYLLLTKFRAFS